MRRSNRYLPKRTHLEPNENWSHIDVALRWSIIYDLQKVQADLSKELQNWYFSRKFYAQYSKSSFIIFVAFLDAELF